MSNRKRIAPPSPQNTPDKVFLGFLHPGTVNTDFMVSVMNLWAYDAQHNRRLFDGGGIAHYQAGANLSKPRNMLAQQFMESKASWLLMVDADMTFQPNALDQLIQAADPVDRPIVGGLCFGLDGEGSAPTLYDIFQGENGEPEVGRYRQWEPGSLMKVAGTGTAFLLVHRSVFEKFDAFEPKPGVTAFNKAFPYFQETEYFGKPIGEDLTFCFRAGFLNIPVYVDTSCLIGHIKTRELTLDNYLYEQGLLSPKHVGAAS